MVEKNAVEAEGRGGKTAVQGLQSSYGFGGRAKGGKLEGIVSSKKPENETIRVAGERGPCDTKISKRKSIIPVLSVKSRKKDGTMEIPEWEPFT